MKKHLLFVAALLLGPSCFATYWVGVDGLFVVQKGGDAPFVETGGGATHSVGKRFQGGVRFWGVAPAGCSGNHWLLTLTSLNTDQKHAVQTGAGEEATLLVGSVSSTDPARAQGSLHYSFTSAVLALSSCFGQGSYYSCSGWLGAEWYRLNTRLEANLHDRATGALLGRGEVSSEGWGVGPAVGGKLKTGYCQWQLSASVDVALLAGVVRHLRTGMAGKSSCRLMPALRARAEVGTCVCAGLYLGAGIESATYFGTVVFRKEDGGKDVHSYSYQGFYGRVGVNF